MKPEDVLSAELSVLEWRPSEGVAFLQRVLAAPAPSAALVELSMCWLSLYYQELDDPISACRAALSGGLPPHEAAPELLRHLEGL